MYREHLLQELIPNFSWLLVFAINFFIQRVSLSLKGIVLCGIKLVKITIIVSLKTDTCLSTSKLERIIQIIE